MILRRRVGPLMKKQLLTGTRRTLRALALMPAFLLLISCGATHYQNRTQTIFDGGGPTPTPTPVPLATPTLNMPWVFKGPSVVASGMPFVPEYELPCDNGTIASGEWAASCINAG